MIQMITIFTIFTMITIFTIWSKWSPYDHLETFLSWTPTSSVPSRMSMVPQITDSSLLRLIDDHHYDYYYYYNNKSVMVAMSMIMAVAMMNMKTLRWKPYVSPHIFIMIIMWENFNFFQAHVMFEVTDFPNFPYNRDKHYKISNVAYRSYESGMQQWT